MTSFSKLKMILQHLNDFYQPFSRYIASKVTYSHPNIAYLSSYLRLRKFRQCRNSTFGRRTVLGKKWARRAGTALWTFSKKWKPVRFLHPIGNTGSWKTESLTKLNLIENKMKV
jgi:hypothetical protein